MKVKCPYCLSSNTKRTDECHRNIHKIPDSKNNNSYVYSCLDCQEEFYPRQKKINTRLPVDTFIKQDYAYYNTGQINKETMR